MVAGGLQPPSQQEEAAKEAAKKQGVIFVLENASLEIAKVGKVQPQCPPQHTFWTACLLLRPLMYTSVACGWRGWHAFRILQRLEHAATPGLGVDVGVIAVFICWVEFQSVRTRQTRLLCVRRRLFS